MRKTLWLLLLLSSNAFADPSTMDVSGVIGGSLVLNPYKCPEQAACEPFKSTPTYKINARYSKDSISSTAVLSQDAKGKPLFSILQLVFNLNDTTSINIGRIAITQGLHPLFEGKFVPTADRPDTNSVFLRAFKEGIAPEYGTIAHHDFGKGTGAYFGVYRPLNRLIAASAVARGLPATQQMVKISNIVAGGVITHYKTANFYYDASLLSLENVPDAYVQTVSSQISIKNITTEAEASLFLSNWNSIITTVSGRLFYEHTKYKEYIGVNYTSGVYDSHELIIGSIIDSPSTGFIFRPSVSYLTGRVNEIRLPDPSPQLLFKFAVGYKF